MDTREMHNSISHFVVNRRHAMLAVGGSVLASSAPAAADYWSYPLSSWSISRDFGVWVNNWNGAGASGYHLGQDVAMQALTMVKNARWGFVRFAGPASGYGNAVIIESPREYETSTDPSKWTNPYTQIFGHLRADSYLAATKKLIGKTVDRGVVIGRLGYSSENGGFAPHLHYGIRKGRYSSKWVYFGYSSSKDVLSQWVKPSTVIKNY